MNKNNQIHPAKDESEVAAYETVIDDLNKIMAKWSEEKLNAGPVLTAMLLVIHDQVFAQYSNPQTAVNIILDSLDAAIETNVEDEEFKAMHQVLSLKERQLH